MSRTGTEEPAAKGNSMIAATKNNNDPSKSWSHVLATPTSGDLFSPARPLADKECLHGAGYQKALDHGKMVSRAGKRCALMLLEGANCYEQFGVALMKACQANPLGEGETFKSINSLSQQTRMLSSRLKEEIGTPLQGYHTSMGETFPSIQQKYTQSRQKAHGARQRAVLARTKNLKAVSDAEQACNTVEKTVAETKNGESPKEDTISNPPNSTSKAEWDKALEEYGKLKGQRALDQVNNLLNEVKVQQGRYEALVEKENSAIKLCQKLEAASLEGFQKMEEQRLCVFTDCLVRTFEAIKVSLDNLVISAELDLDESERQVKVVQNNKKGDFFSTILKVGASQEETTGVSDAETLGLDEDVGRLRDAVQKSRSSRLAKLKKVKALAVLFADVASAAVKLGNGLQLMAKHEDSFVSSKGAPIEHLRTILSSCEGPRTLQLWNDLVNTIDREGEAFLQFSRDLGSIKESKLDAFLSTNESSIKDMAEQDDARWKHLCDAARTESRAESKYRQSTVQTAKARERMGSVDANNLEADGTKATKTPQKPQNRARDNMNKAFGNFLSILPDGGEQAMQILSPDARRLVVEKQVAEADEKELKVKQGYDNAIAYKNKVMDSYRLNAQQLVEKYQQEESAGVVDVKAAMESLVAGLNKLRISRYDTLTPLSRLGDQPRANALVDLKEWAEKTSKELKAKKPADIQNDAPATTGFMLALVLAESENAKRVLQLAKIGKSDSFESDCSDRSREKDDADGTGLTVRVSTGQDSSRSLDLNTAKNEEGETENDKDKEKGEATGGQQTAQWLKKSFASPIGKSGGFKFRKLQSPDNGEEAADDATETSTISATIPPQNSEELSESELFSLFWPDYDGTTPGVTHSFACAFLPKDCTVKSVAGVEHGRLFLTYRGAVFIAWRGRKAIILFSLMQEAEKKDNLFGLEEDTLLISAQSKGTPTSILLSCFNHRDQALDVLQKRLDAAKKARAEDEKALKVEESKSAKSADKGVVISTPVPPDPRLSSMEMVLSKKIRGIPISRFHDIVWQDKTSEDTFYVAWLNSGGSCSDIKCGEWETSDTGFKGPWCGETYSHKRQLTFQLKRNSMIGPPVAGVTQTQYCRAEGNDRSVMMMTVSFDGIPYSDSFTVEVRWVASRSGAKDIAIQVGVFVEFHKSTLLKSQIRNGTLSETKPVHESLFAYVKEALSKEVVVTEEEAGGEGQVDDNDNSEDEEDVQEKMDSDKEDSLFGTITSFIPGIVMENLHIAAPVMGVVCLLCFRSVFGWGSSNEVARLNAKVDDLQTEMRLMRQSIEQLTSLLKEQNRR